MRIQPLDVGLYFDKLNIRRSPIPVCAACGARTKPADTESVYCSICGLETRVEEGVREMVYKSIQTTSQGKALVCPHCDNEELNAGDYCKICGNEVINRCGDMCDASDDRVISRSCQNILTGNARFCPHCGNESTFFQKGWLSDWRSENLRKALQNLNAPAPAVNINDYRGFREEVTS